MESWYNGVSRETMGLTMDIRIEGKRNISCGCCDEPATVFRIFEPCRDEHGRVAYVFAGEFAADGHDADDGQCLAEYQRIRFLPDHAMWTKL